MGRINTSNIFYDELIKKWSDLSDIDLNEFKALFVDTWRFFMESEYDTKRISLKNARLLCLLNRIIFEDSYIEAFRCSEYDACMCFVKGLCDSILNPELGYGHTIWDGWIAIQVYIDEKSSLVHIDNFEQEFKELCYEYFENVYDGDEEFDCIKGE